jgi:hypothetical protein
MVAPERAPNLEKSIPKGTPDEARPLHPLAIREIIVKARRN